MEGDEIRRDESKERVGEELIEAGEIRLRRGEMKKWKRDSRRVRGDGDEMRKREGERERRREMINGRDEKKRRLDGV